MSYLLLIVLMASSLAAVGGAVVITYIEIRNKIRSRLASPDQDDQADSDTVRMGAALSAVHRVGSAVSGKSGSTTLQEQLTRAGYHGASAATVYMGAKIVLLVLGVLGTSAAMLTVDWAVTTRLLVIAATSAGLSFIPNVVVTAKRKYRKSDIRHHLPDAVDLLEICVSAGMGLDMAWNMVTEEIRRVSSILADEMALTNLEIHLGSPRVAAMHHLAERTDVEEFRSLVALLIQSDRFGTSIADALQTFAQSMREGRTSQAEEAAEKMAVELLFPMVLFIFPAVFIVTVGPAGITLARIMGK